MNENAGRTNVIFDYEHAAMKGEPLPDNLSSPDQIMYLQLRQLYYQVKIGVISRDCAIKEKTKLIKQHKVNLFREKVYDYNLELKKRTERANAKFRKERTLENADFLVNIIDGLERDF